MPATKKKVRITYLTVNGRRSTVTIKSGPRAVTAWASRKGVAASEILNVVEVSA